MAPEVAPYGAWRSPISSGLLVQGAVFLDDLATDHGDVFWAEARPSEAGRVTLVRRRPGGETSDLTLAPFNVRTRVHEYGGGAFILGGGAAFFSSFSDQRVYRIELAREEAVGPVAATPRPITPPGAMRYADGDFDGRRNRIIYVREDHSVCQEAVNTLVAVDANPGVAAAEGASDHDSAGAGVAANTGDAANTGQILVSGDDFYASPRLSPDGTRLAWLSWKHPNMPWDGTELWVGELGPNGLLLASRRLVAGGPAESVFQPEWSPGGVLHFVSDRTGWWNLYRLPAGATTPEPLAPMEAEFGEPLWVLGMRTYAFGPGGRQLFCTYRRDGASHLAVIDTATLALRDIPTPFTEITYVTAHGDRVLFVGGSPTDFAALAAVDPASGAIEILRRTSTLSIDPGCVSVAEAITFPTEDGLEAHALFYWPRNAGYAAPPGELPPVIVRSHGGPTGAASSSLDLGIQYWTSRGIAFVDVDYGGSTGYGRPYRERLNGRWGLVDVDDCCNAVRHLIARGEVDPNRTIIAGGSAGGYTTLAALAFRDTFKAGASRFGISDLELMAAETHKFESRYIARLVAPYPERRDVFLARSPIHHVDRLSCPTIFFQGLDDKVVPPDQAELMVSKLRAKGLPVAYLAFAGEGHGFRRAENIIRTQEAQLYFFSRVFGFQPADDLEPVEIENL